MESCLGLINFEDIGRNFEELCRSRPAYMLPFGGRYRLVDFALSNMVNHGIRTVATYTGDKIRSTMDHLGDGRPWELNRRINGLFIFPPQFDDENHRQGNIYQYYMTEDFFLNTKEEYILIANPNILAKVDLTEAFSHFRESDADVCLIYKKKTNDGDMNINSEKLIIDENGDLINIGLNLGAESEFNLFMHMGFVKKEVFLKIIKKSMETGNDMYFKQALMKDKGEYKINTYEFKGHVESITGIESYYNANMNLLDEDIFNELFFQGGPIFTTSKDEPSTLYAPGSKVKNSLVANGCIIEGTVENSILFRGVKVGKNARVKNSILMQKTIVEEDSVIVNTISDKYGTIKKGSRIAGSKSNPYIIGKRAIVREG